MKTRRIWAGSIAAVLAFSVVAVSAAYATEPEPTTNEESSTTSTEESSTTSTEESSTTSTEESSTTSTEESSTTSTEESSSGGSSAVEIVADEDGVDIGGGVTIVINDKDENKFEDYTISASAVTVAAAGGKVDVANTSELDGLSKALKKEIGKIDSDKFEMINIDLADGIYAASTAPAGIQLKVVSSIDGKVYHVNGENVELLKSTSKKLADGSGYEITFTTKNFSPFIITTAELKNAKATTSDNDPTDSDTSADGASNANTGIALAIAPVVLAAGAVAVVALKKKH